MSKTESHTPNLIDQELRLEFPVTSEVADSLLPELEGLSLDRRGFGL